MPDGWSRPYGATIIDPANTDKLEEYVELLYETRKSKGMTPEKARDSVNGLPYLRRYYGKSQ